MIKIKNVTHGKRNKNRYCGPGAISAIAGVTAEKAAKLIADFSGKSQAYQRRFEKNASRTGMGFGVKGTDPRVMIRVLNSLGYSAIEQVAKTQDAKHYFVETASGVEPVRKLRRKKHPGEIWIKDGVMSDVPPDCVLELPTLNQWDNERRRTTDLYLIILTSHYVVVQGDKIVDNQLETVRSLSDTKHYKRARVKRVLRIERKKAA